MSKPGRDTEEYYEWFVRGLCDGPPGRERDECTRTMIGRLLALYAEFGITPPEGLAECARRFKGGVGDDDGAHPR